MNSPESLYFLSFCIEAYKMRHRISGAEALVLFEKFDVTDYLLANYEVLHTQSEQWIVDDIENFIHSKQ